MNKKLTQADLEKALSEMVTNIPNSNIMMHTGRGGMKNLLKAYAAEMFPGRKYDFKIMLAVYRFLKQTNTIEQAGGVYKIS